MVSLCSANDVPRSFNLEIALAPADDKTFCTVLYHGPFRGEPYEGAILYFASLSL